jgi:hypothetical protein
VQIYILPARSGYASGKMGLRKFGGPQALPGGAKPHSKGVYPPEGLRSQ